MNMSSASVSHEALLRGESSLNLLEATRVMIEQARQLVSQLVNNRGNDKPPFMPEEFARLKGVNQIVEAELGDTSGILLRLHDGFVIKVNKNHYPVRQRFSCAHEVGHLLFNDLGLERYLQKVEYRASNNQGRSKARRYLQRIKERESPYNPQRNVEPRARARERLCDIAATELLMPEGVFRRYLSQFGVSVNSVEGLAHTFGVSIPAAAFRIAEVSPKPCATLRWEPRLIAGSKSLKLAGCIGPGISLRNVDRCVPTHDIVRYTSTSILHKAFKESAIYKCYMQFRCGAEDKRLAMESKGFGYGDNRYVISLAFLKNE